MSNLDLLICTLQHENEDLRKQLYHARRALQRLERDHEARLHRVLRMNEEVARLRGVLGRLLPSEFGAAPNRHGDPRAL